MRLLNTSLRNAIRGFAFSLIAAHPALASDVDLERLETIWRAWIAENNVSEATLVVASDTSVLRALGFNRSPDKPVDLASLAKPILATCVSNLVYAGRLSFEWTLGQIFGPDLGTLGLHAPENADITISELLTHSTGLSTDHTQNGGLRAFYGTPENRDDVVAERALSEPRDASKIGVYAYNNENYQILGLIVSTVTGLPAEAACEEITGVPWIEVSSIWGAFGSAAGWRVSSTDYVAFLQANFTAKSRIGQQIAHSLPMIWVRRNLYYTTGAIAYLDGNDLDRIEARGSMHAGANGRADAGFFLVWPQGPIIFVTFDTVGDGRKQTALLKAMRAVID